MNRLAFTLAEVLITLGIIGIIAAMTIPSLIQKKTNRELQTALQKNYSVLQSALEKANEEHGETLKPSNIGERKLKSILMPQLKYSKDCNHNSCIPTYRDGTDYKTYNKKQALNVNLFDDGQFILNDGSMYLIENQGYNSIYITIDVNGINKKPNLWGHDLFTFQLTNNGKLLPMGALGTTYHANRYCSYTSEDSLNGIACTYNALTDKNYWDNLP